MLSSLVNLSYAVSYHEFGLRYRDGSRPLTLEELGSSLVKEIKGIRNDVEMGIVDLERVAWMFGEAKLLMEK